VTVNGPNRHRLFAQQRAARTRTWCPSVGLADLLAERVPNQVPRKPCAGSGAGRAATELDRAGATLAAPGIGAIEIDDACA